MDLCLSSQQDGANLRAPFTIHDSRFFSYSRILSKCKTILSRKSQIIIKNSFPSASALKFKFTTLTHSILNFSQFVYLRRLLRGRHISGRFSTLFQHQSAVSSSRVRSVFASRNFSVAASHFETYTPFKRFMKHT